MYTKGHFSQILVTNLSKSMLYNDLLYLYNPVLGTQSALNSKGESPHPPPVCSIHLDDATAAILRQNAHHRVMKPISVWGLLGGHDGQRPMGKFGQDAGVTPLRCAKFIPVFVQVRSSIVQLRVPTYNHNKFVLHCFFRFSASSYSFSKDILGFLMTTESQDLGLTSHPKDGAFYSIVSPSLHWGVT